MLACPGTIDITEAALDYSADLPGGIDPAGIDGDVAGQLDLLFAFAERKGVEIDIHLHDGGERGAAEMDAIVERTRAHGMQGRVAISHGFCLGDIDESDAARRIEAMADAGVANVTHAPCGSSIPPAARRRPRKKAKAARADSGDDGSGLL